MTRYFAWGVWVLAASWVVLLFSFEAIPLGTAVFLPGSYVASLCLGLVLAAIIGATRGDIGFGVSLGAAGATLTGPLISIGLPPALAYAGSATALGVGNSFYVRCGAAATFIAGAAQAVCLIVLARRQFGIGQSRLETDPTDLLPMLAIWAVFSCVNAVRRMRDSF